MSSQSPPPPCALFVDWIVDQVPVDPTSLHATPSFVAPTPPPPPPPRVMALYGPAPGTADFGRDCWFFFSVDLPSPLGLKARFLSP
jgi:hypothetical protein